MRQHGSERDIANAFNVLDGGVELVVDDDPAFVIQFYTDRFQIQSFDVGAATDGH